MSVYNLSTVGSETTPKKKRRIRLTTKQRELVKASLKNPDATLTELAQQANYNDRAAVCQALKSPAVQGRIQEMLEAHPELTRNKRIERLAQGVWAKKRIPVGEKIIEVDDLQTSKPYLEMAFKLAGDLKGPEDAVQGDKLSLAILIVRERERRGLDPIPADVIKERPMPQEEQSR